MLNVCFGAYTLAAPKMELRLIRRDDVPRMPVMTKETALSFARSGRMKFLRYGTSDIHVRVYGDAAVVTGRLERARTMNGQGLTDDWRFAKVYIREAQKWRVVAFQASEAARP